MHHLMEEWEGKSLARRARRAEEVGRDRGQWLGEVILLWAKLPRAKSRRKRARLRKAGRIKLRLIKSQPTREQATKARRTKAPQTKAMRARLPVHAETPSPPRQAARRAGSGEGQARGPRQDAAGLMKNAEPLGDGRFRFRGSPDSAQEFCGAGAARLEMAASRAMSYGKSSPQAAPGDCSDRRQGGAEHSEVVLCDGKPAVLGTVVARTASSSPRSASFLARSPARSARMSCPRRLSKKGASMIWPC